jgi:opacity protein-like surface antigen
MSRGGCKSVAQVLSALVVTASLASRSFGAAREIMRDHKVELYLVAQYDASDTVASDSDSSFKVDVKPGFSGGVGVGYNIGSFFNVNAEITGGQIKFEDPDRFDSSSATMIRADLNLEIYPLDRPLTPFVGGGFGLMNIRNDFASETDPTFNGTAGLRWDINDRVFMKAYYRATFTHFKDADGLAMFNGGGVVLGFKF